MLRQHTIRRYAKAGVLAVALIVLAVEGYLLYGHYGDASRGTGVPVLEETTGRTATGSGDAGGPGASEAAVPPEVEASFVHRATDANSRGDYTYIGHPRLDGNPGAVVLAEPTPGRGGGRDSAYGHNIGVWYEPGKKRWAIFNQDRAPVPAGSLFRVVVPPADRGFVHRAKLTNTVGDATYLDDPLTNGEPDAVLSVTQNWNPGGGAGVYNDHALRVLYDENMGRWSIYSRDGAPIPGGAAFNVAVSGDPAPSG